MSKSQEKRLAAQRKNDERDAKIEEERLRIERYNNRTPEEIKEDNNRKISAKLKMASLMGIVANRKQSLVCSLFDPLHKLFEEK